MGRQVNFYLSKGDQAELAEKFDRLGTVLAIPYSSATPKSTSLPVSGFAHWIPDLSPPNLFRPEDIDGLVSRRTVMNDPKLGVRYFIDIFRSPVIEFSPCVYEDNQIRRGRLYYMPSYYDENSQLIQKPPDFISWATGLFKIIKKGCLRNAEGNYVGKRAQDLISKGSARIELNQ